MRRSLIRWSKSTKQTVVIVLLVLGVSSYSIFTQQGFSRLAGRIFPGASSATNLGNDVALKTKSHSPDIEWLSDEALLNNADIEWLSQEVLLSKGDPASFDPSFPYKSAYGKMNLSGYSAPYVRSPPRSTKPMKNIKLFTKVQACLRDSPYISDDIRQKPILEDPNYELPMDIAEHYAEMLRITEKLRHRKWHSYGGYSGPWIENLFISNFCCDRPLSFFGGLVPLFVQWTDLWHIGNMFDERHLDFPEFKLFLSKLRHDVIYVTVSQHDTGIFNSGNAIHPSRNWNIFTLSSGGIGNVALPLMSGHLKLVGLDTEAWNLFVFAGKFLAYDTRHKMRRAFEALQRRDTGFNYQLYQGPKWREVMKTGLLNVIPRGFGRSSFRMSEVIQMGFIPVYLYDDEDWSPYKGTPAHMSRFGYVMRDSQFEVFAEKVFNRFLENRTFIVTELKRKYDILKAYRDLYTFPGVFRQMEYFFHDSSRTLFTCQRVPARFN